MSCLMSPCSLFLLGKRLTAPRGGDCPSVEASTSHDPRLQHESPSPVGALFPTLLCPILSTLAELHLM